MSRGRRPPDKKHARLGPSGAERWLACPPSVAASEGKRGSSSAAAEEGTLAHAVLETALLLQYTAEEILHYDQHEGEEIPEEMRRCVARAINYVHRWEEEHPNGKVFIEHVVTPGELIERDDCFGTGDILLLDAPALTLEVVDYKHGKKRVKAEDNPQAKLYGVGGVMQCFPRSQWEKVKVKLVIIQPRKSDFADEWETTGKVLLKWMRETVAPAAEASDDINGPRTPGDYCFFCRAAPSCRELTKSMFNAAAMEFGSEEEQGPVDPDELSAEEIAYALAFVPMMERWCEVMREEGRRLKLEGHDLPGMNLVFKRHRRAWQDNAPKVVQWLTRRKLDLDAFAPRDPLPVGQMFKELKRVGLVGDKVKQLDTLVKLPPQEIVIAPEGDSREVVPVKDYDKYR